MCSEEADIAFVVDTSGGISEEDFKKQVKFVKALASSFDPTYTKHQLGLISYGRNAKMEVSFKDKVDREEFEKAVDRMPHTKSRPRLDKALKLASSKLFTAKGGIRSGKKKAMIIFTDGKKSPDPKAVPLKDVIEPLKQLDVQIYAVAIKSQLDQKELTKELAHWFTVFDFDLLANMVELIELTTCRIPAPSPGK